LLAPAIGHALDARLDGARKLLLGGKYAEAAEIYAPLAATDAAAALGLARCQEAQGKTDAADATLKLLAEKRAALQAELAQLAFDRGDLKEAKTRADAAVKLDGEQLPARWILAELARSAGRLDEAERGYRWFIDYYNDHNVKDAESLHCIGLAAAQYARWNRLSDQFHFLVNELYPDALKLDPAYWPAHYEAGMLFLEKHNEADAGKEFKAALELNPQAAEVHAAMAVLALENRKIDAAEASLRRALEINPRLLNAWQVKADLAWVSLEAHQTLNVLREKVLPLNPVDEETLGRIAACYVLMEEVPGDRPAGDPAKRLSQLIGEVAGRNPHAGDFYYTLAAMLENRNKQAEAERFFQEAIRVMPKLIGPQSDLGLIYMRMGREAEAKKLLQDAFDADPFNLRVKNTLDVLDVIDTMKTATSEHFVVKYDATADKWLGRYAVRHLENIYPELCKLFGYEPPNRSLVEIFNVAEGLDGHQWFSARMVGLPFLDTVAASTGRIVAMASPNEAGVARKINWARVLRHEFVHVITLQQTKFNIPTWYTEGLAVWCEGYPRPQAWNELLLDRLSRGKLFNLQTINLGFAQPGSGEQRLLAYCQAELYVEYMLSRGGVESLRKMLAAYADGTTTAQAVSKVFGASQEEFERGYMAFVKRLADGLRGLKRPSRARFLDLLKASSDHPDDAEAAAEVAYDCLRCGSAWDAQQFAERSLKLRPRQPLATYVTARLLIADKKVDESAAISMLEAALDRKSPEPLLLDLLAELKLKAKKYAEATELYLLGERLEPTNTTWTRALAKVYLAAEQKTLLAATLTRLVKADSDDQTARTMLAELALAGQDYEATIRWANQGLEIDVNDGELHRLLAEGLAGRQKYEAAIEEYEIAIELNPLHPQQRFALADACIQAHQTAKARQALLGLLKMAPDYPGAETLLESLKEQKSKEQGTVPP
jgi:tetratricopeptide (TPR) repeat protein